VHKVTVKWRRLDIPGHESCELVSNPDGWALQGTATLEHEKQLCRLDYQIDCDPLWITRAASVRGNVGARTIDVRIVRRADGTWLLNDEPVDGVAGCLDVDLNFSPSTNLLPIRRLKLAIGRKAGVRAAWLRFPSFLLEPLDQSYERIAESTFRYESAGGSFVADLDVGESGLPIRYGNLWTADAT
jgi:uncharacterized protein